MFSVSNENEFKNIVNSLIENSDKRMKAGKINQDYIKKNKGAVVQIMDFIRK